MRILCVDDDPVILGLFEKSLARIDIPEYQYLSSASGKEAIALTTESPVDLVLLDNMLPDISGIDVLEKIKGSHPETEVLMITGHASVSDAVKAMKAGARDYIEKPFHLDLLREKVYNLLEFRLRNREAEDYRFAKEAVENGASREITSLEEAIDTIKKCQLRVMSILESDRPDSRKLEDIRKEISDHTVGC
jgi:DNA-binding NtrC family response regulator